MSRGKVAAAMITPGAIALLIGLFMESSADSVKFMLFGGFLLIAGMVLHVSRTPEQIKSEEEEERKSDELMQEKWKKREARLDKHAEAMSQELRSLFVSNIPKSEFNWRVVIGAFVGFVLMVAFPAVFVGDVTTAQPFWFLVVIGSMTYSLRAMPYATVTKRLWIALLLVGVPALMFAGSNVLSLRAELATDLQPGYDGYAEFVRKVIRAERAVWVLIVGVVVAGIALYRSSPPVFISDTKDQFGFRVLVGVLTGVLLGGFAVIGGNVWNWLVGFLALAYAFRAKPSQIVLARLLITTLVLCLLLITGLLTVTGYSPGLLKLVAVALILLLLLRVVRRRGKRAISAPEQASTDDSWGA